MGPVDPNPAVTGQAALDLSLARPSPLGVGDLRFWLGHLSPSVDPPAKRDPGSAGSVGLKNA